MLRRHEAAASIRRPDRSVGPIIRPVEASGLAGITVGGAARLDAGLPGCIALAAVVGLLQVHEDRAGLIPASLFLVTSRRRPMPAEFRGELRASESGPDIRSMAPTGSRAALGAPRGRGDAAGSPSKRRRSRRSSRP